MNFPELKYKQLNIQYIDKASEEIFKRKEHAFAGVSPFNSYYTVETIEKLIQWLQKHFDRFTIFLPDELYYYNFLGLGYTEEKAKHKTARKDSNLYNRIIRAFDQLGISESERNILKYSQLKTSVLYREKYLKYREIIENDDILKNIIYESITKLQIVDGKELNVNKEIAFNYFLHELPTFLNIPTLLNVPSSCCVYHQLPPLLNYIYNEKYLQDKDQGFIAVNFE